MICSICNISNSNLNNIYKGNHEKCLKDLIRYNNLHNIDNNIDVSILSKIQSIIDYEDIEISKQEAILKAQKIKEENIIKKINTQADIEDIKYDSLIESGIDVNVKFEYEKYSIIKGLKRFIIKVKCVGGQFKVNNNEMCPAVDIFTLAPKGSIAKAECKNKIPTKIIIKK